MSIADIGDALVIREDAAFLLTDPSGNVPAGNKQGLGAYRADTRHLSTYRFTLGGIEPVVLLSTAELGYAMEQVLTNPAIMVDGRDSIERGRLEIRRQRTIAEVVEEVVHITNFHTAPVTVPVRYEFAADFADIFDVRGYERRRRGEAFAPEVGARSIAYRYRGIDGRQRATRVVFDRDPEHIDENVARLQITLQPRERATFSLTIAFDDAVPGPPAGRTARSLSKLHEDWLAGCTEIVTDNQFFNRVMERSLRDVRMLLQRDAQGREFPVAGTPWFDALFGRDSCISSMQMLAYQPEIARSTLLLLASLQGKRLEPSRDEEPGKILHEMRYGELSRAGELPYGPYYGSVDSTPLYLMLLAEYCAWTDDIDLARSLLGTVKDAVHWLDVYGDPLDTGYLSYEKHSANGLVNQGWKDSWDAVLHEDGTCPPPPTMLVEAQGYAYAARVRMAPILDRLGETELAQELRSAAARLRSQFHEAFWMPDREYFAMALDGDGRPVRSITTNPAHCLWTGLIEPTYAAAIARRLLSPPMFSGWGVRTLENTHPRYNPIGYHVGSIWPHDNSIAAMGLKMYGFEEEAGTIATALFDTAAAFPYFRLPELFSGDARSEHNSPVPYPVACRPQAWAAGAIPYITQAMLGLQAEAPAKRLRVVSPRLPRWLDWIQVRDIRVGRGSVTLQFRRSGENTNVEVQQTTGDIDVVVSRRWAMPE
ncbi:MAG TPA: glycogen debranching N-terminal domain-containing protein [Dehalococcoidia bacterium]|nr:glycogen debranching N-terminal domain-containing protein [Dehalococcoidia bacterium]